MIGLAHLGTLRFHLPCKTRLSNGNMKTKVLETKYNVEWDVEETFKITLGSGIVPTEGSEPSHDTTFTKEMSLIKSYTLLM